MKVTENENVLRLTGISQNPNTKSPELIMHYMNKGSLKNYIENYENDITYNASVRFCLQAMDERTTNTNFFELSSTNEHGTRTGRNLVFFHPCFKLQKAWSI